MNDRVRPGYLGQQPFDVRSLRPLAVRRRKKADVALSSDRPSHGGADENAVLPGEMVRTSESGHAFIARDAMYVIAYYWYCSANAQELCAETP